MKELSLHILDIVQNSITANASLIEITISVNGIQDCLEIVISDNGRGMDAAMVKKVQSPFTTSRTTRRVGLGIPLFKESAERTGGSFSIESEPGVGTKVTAVYQLSNIDRAPLGNIAQTMFTLIAANPRIDFLFRYRVEEAEYTFDTREVKNILGEVPITTPDVMAWIQESLAEGVRELRGGVSL